MTTTADEFKVISLENLTESKLNPRHHFNPDGLCQLAESIKTKGLIQPLTVRAKGAMGKEPVSAGEGRAGEMYEIVAGARRFRACQLAGLTEVQCVVRELTDLDVLEVMVIENNQREDVHPLEEAEGYQRLMAMAGKGSGKLHVAAIAAKIGRSVNYVYDRVKLLALTKEAQELFWAGLITAGHAILLARLSPTEQARVIGTKNDGYAGGLFEGTRNLNFTPEEEEAGAGDDETAMLKPVSVRELQAYIDDHVKFGKTKVDQLLFPETAEVLAKARNDAEKIVQITHEARVNPDAKEGNTERIFCYTSWARADGKHGSKPCEKSVTGVIVAGAGRGQAFKVCTDKHTCTVHWGKVIKERERREKGTPASGSSQSSSAAERQARERKKDEEERATREAERARFQKAIPAILKALAECVKKAQTKANGLLGDLIIEAIDNYSGYGKEAAKLIPRGTSPDDLIRHVAFFILMDRAHDYDAMEELSRQAKAFGLDLATILNAVAPLVMKKPCTVCGTKNIDPTTHVCSPAALQKAKKKAPVKTKAKAKNGTKKKAA